MATMYLADLPRLNGGEGEIRTPEGLTTLPVFKTGAIDHSATSPYYLITLRPPI